MRRALRVPGWDRHGVWRFSSRPGRLPLTRGRWNSISARRKRAGDHELGERGFALGHPQEVHRVLPRDGEAQRFGIVQARTSSEANRMSRRAT